MTVVILSATIPTAIAQRFFSPPVHELTPDDVVAVEDEEFGRRRRRGAIPLPERAGESE